MILVTKLATAVYDITHHVGIIPLFLPDLACQSLGLPSTVCTSRNHLVDTLRCIIKPGIIPLCFSLAGLPGSRLHFSPFTCFQAFSSSQCSQFVKCVWQPRGDSQIRFPAKIFAEFQVIITSCLFDNFPKKILNPVFIDVIEQRLLGEADGNEPVACSDITQSVFSDVNRHGLASVIFQHTLNSQYSTGALCRSQ